MQRVPFFIEEMATASKRQIRVSRGNDVRYSGFSLEKKRCYVLFTFVGIPRIVFGSLVVAVLAKEKCNNLK